MKNKLSLIVAGALISISIVGCKKKDTNNSNSNTNTNSDVSTATDNNLADAAFNDVQNISDQASTGTLVFYSPLYSGDGKEINSDQYAKSSCATITHDTVSVPHLLTIDFGTVNCQCNDGKNRRGKILVSYQGHYRDSASVHTITFDNYFVNDNQILGTKTVTNNGHNANGNLTYSIHVNGQVIKANNGGTITWLSDRIREWTVGENTLTWADDVYSITGNGSGTSASGVAYTINITTPLVRALICHWFESGVVDVTPSGLPTRTINYGTSGCDANATVTINGTTYPILLN
ncbi:MAG: hypothetical protein HYR91_09665 [Flavobacteriia bacterium]|nr:hypothetical protein [Flavobacteriia bacterium]